MGQLHFGPNSRTHICGPCSGKDTFARFIVKFDVLLEERTNHWTGNAYKVYTHSCMVVERYILVGLCRVAYISTAKGPQIYHLDLHALAHFAFKNKNVTWINVTCKINLDLLFCMTQDRHVLETASSPIHRQKSHFPQKATSRGMDVGVDIDKPPVLPQTFKGDAAIVASRIIHDENIGSTCLYNVSNVVVRDIKIYSAHTRTQAKNRVPTRNCPIHKESEYPRKNTFRFFPNNKFIATACK